MFFQCFRGGNPTNLTRVTFFATLRSSLLISAYVRWTVSEAKLRLSALHRLLEQYLLVEDGGNDWWIVFWIGFWSKMYAMMSGSHVALNCPGFGMRFDVTFSLIRKRKRTVGSAGESVWCTNRDLFPTGATHAEKCMIFYAIVCKIQSASRELRFKWCALK